VQAVQVMGGLLGAVHGRGGARPNGPNMPWEERGAVPAGQAMGGLLGAVQGMGGARGRAGRAGHGRRSGPCRPCRSWEAC
jgi:hypothetical protein